MSESEWTPRYTVAKHRDVGSSAGIGSPPCLVIRAHDVLAVEAMDWYLGRYELQEGAAPAVRDRLLAHRTELVAWRRTHRDRIKTAD